MLLVVAVGVVMVFILETMVDLVVVAAVDHLELVEMETHHQYHHPKEILDLMPLMLIPEGIGKVVAVVVPVVVDLKLQ